MQIDIKKKYRTKDGREVRLYAVDGSATRPVHGAYKQQDGWVECSWTSIGHHESPDSYGFQPGSVLDIVEARPRFQYTFWANLYDDGSVPKLYWTRSHAEAARTSGCVATVRWISEGDIGQGLPGSQF